MSIPEVRTPHELSLPLFDLLQEADNQEDLQHTLQKLQDGIRGLHIESHVTPVLSFDQDRDVVNVEPLDSFGAAICIELRERITYPPCPDNMCEPVVSKITGTSACRWCGKDIQLN